MKKTTKRIIVILMAVVIAVASIGTVAALALNSAAGLSSLKTAITNYENKIKSGTIYTNMEAAYTAYVNANKYYDKYYYGDDTSITSQTLQNYADALNNATDAMKVWTAPAVKNNNLTSGDKVWSEDSQTWSAVQSLYSNVIWSNKNYDNTRRAYDEGYQSTSSSNIGSLVQNGLYYPAYVLLNDGVNTPSFGILVFSNGRVGSSSWTYGDSGRNRYMTAITVDNSQLSLTRNWTTNNGTDTSATAATMDHIWNYNGSSASLSYSNTNSMGASGAQVRKSGTTGATFYYRRFANVAYLNPSSISNSTYYTEVFPTVTAYFNGGGIGDANWNSDFTQKLTGEFPVKIVNYVPLKNAINSSKVNGYLKAIGSYKEGGLSGLFSALDEATKFDYNDYFPSDDWYNAIYVWSENCGNEIQRLTEQLNGLATPQIDQYSELRKAIGEMDIEGQGRYEYDKYSQSPGDNTWMARYCEPEWTVYETALKNAKAAIISGANNYYRDASGAASAASALNSAHSGLQKHVAIDDPIEPYHNQTKATCNTDGSYEVWKVCSKCDNELTAHFYYTGDHSHITGWEDYAPQTVTVPKKDHVPIKQGTDRAATCEVDGEKSYYICENGGDTSDGRYDFSSCDGKLYKDNSCTGTYNSANELKIEKLGHADGETKTVIDTPASCTQAGSQTTTVYCVRYDQCKHIMSAETTVIAKENHQWDDENGHEEVKATCVDQGNQEYWYCTSCKTYYKEGDLQTDDAYESYELKEGVDPENCVKTAKLDHKGEEVPEVKATCTEGGNNQYWKCVNGCGLFYKDEACTTVTTEAAEKTDPLNHEMGTPEETITRNQSCTQTGEKKIVTKCVRFDQCGYQTEETVTIEKDDHKWDNDGNAHDANPAECEKPGNNRYWYCESCEKYYKDGDTKTTAAYTSYEPADGVAQEDCVVIPKLGHKVEAIDEKQQTCTDGGNNKYWKCTNGCGKYFKDKDGVADFENETTPEAESGEPLGHQFGDEPSQPAQDATCLHGSYKEIWNCGRCHLDFLADKNTVATDADKKEQPDKLPHNLQKEEAVEATCQHNGNLLYWYCDLGCGLIFHSEEQDSVWNVETDGDYNLPQLAHKYDEDSYEYNNDQDCLINGTETASCIFECGTTDTRDKAGYEALGHDFNWDGGHTVRLEPNCTDSGHVEYYTCKRETCKKNFYVNDKFASDEVTEDQLNLPANGVHVLVDIPASKATCSQPGWNEYYKCGVCSKLFETNVQDDENDPISNHEIEDITKWNGYTANGEHVLVPHAEQEANCEQDGWDPYWECALCNKCYDTGDQGDNFDFDTFDEDHKVADSVDEISDWEDGYTKAETVDHDIQQEVKSEANCVTPGYPDHFECEVCHRWFEDETGEKEISEIPDADINPNNHTGNWTKFEKNDGATCQQAGWTETVYKCDDCGKYYTSYDDETNTTQEDGKTRDALEAEGIYTPQKEHDLLGDKRDRDNDPFIAPTCTSYGYKWVVYTCSMCHTDQKEELEQIDMVAHTPKEAPYQPSTCYSEGVQAHNECEVCGQWFKAEDTDCSGDPLTDEEKAALVIPRASHDYTGDLDKFLVEVVTSASCLKNAEIKVKCKYECGATETRTATEDDCKAKPEYAATGHTFGDMVEKKAATCLEDGVPADYYHCDKCGLNYTDNESFTTNVYEGETVTPKTGHKFQYHEAVAPTCAPDSVGNNAYYTCEYACCEGQYFLEGTDIYSEDYADYETEIKLLTDSNNHPTEKLSTLSEKAADCVTWTNGLRARVYCDSCHNYYEVDDLTRSTPKTEADFTISVSHSLTPVDPKEANCLEGGWKAYYKCTVCDEKFLNNTPNEQYGNSYEDDIVTPANGHTYEAYVPEVKPTCVEGGNQGYVECTVCGKKQICNSLDSAIKDYSDDDNVDLEPVAANHKLNEVAGKPKSCTEDGVKTHFVCEYCSKTFEDQNGNTPLDDITIPAEGHKFDWDGGHTTRLDPTCVDVGNIEYYTCEECQKNFYTNDSWNNTEVENTELTATGIHNLADIPASKATCQQAGWKEYWKCGVCSKLFDTNVQDNEDDPISDHEIADITKWSGYTEKGEHVLVPHAEQEATCEQDGWEQYWECALCSKCYDTGEQDENFVFDKFDEEHKVADSVDEISKWEEGYTKAETVDHKIGQVVKSEANCVTPGYPDHFECEVCHKWFEDETGKKEISEIPDAEINPNNHIGNWTKFEKNDGATCQQAGWTDTYYKCDDCGKYYTSYDDETNTTQEDGKTRDALEAEGIYTPQKEHDLLGGKRDRDESPLIPATCTSVGYKWVEYTCSMCKEVQKTDLEQIPMIAHTPKEVGYKDSTCQQEGVQAHNECEVCGQWFKAEDTDCSGDPLTDEEKAALVIPRASHDYTGDLDEFLVEVVTPASCLKNAEIKVECKYGCGATETRTATEDDCKVKPEYEATGHEFNKHEAKESTCIEAGYDTYYTCDNNCGMLFSDERDDAVIEVVTYKELDPNKHAGEVTLAEAAEDATCLATGWKARYQCSACKKYFDNAEGSGNPKDSAEDSSFIVDAKGHTYEKHDATDSTCKTPGHDLYYYCKNCNTYFSEEDAYKTISGIPYKDIDPNAHPANAVTKVKDAESATCVVNGWVDRYQCSECEKYFDNAEGSGTPRDSVDDENFKTPEKGHSFKAVDAKIPTCEDKDGGWKAHYTCENVGCNLYFLDTTNSFDAVGADYDSEIKLDPDPTNHPAEKLSSLPEQAADCTTWSNGLRARVYCSGCENYYEVDDLTRSEAKEENDFLISPAHTLTPVDPKEANCLEGGWKAYYKCTVCDEKFLNNTPDKQYGNSYEDDIATPAKGHTFEEYNEKLEPTCVDGGHEGYAVCKVCGIKAICASLEDAKANKADYNGNDDVDLEPVPTNHKLKAGDSKDATCTESGIKEHFVCEYCNKTFADQNGDTPLDDINIPAKGHKFEDDNAHHLGVDPSCETAGSIEYYTCDECHKNFYTGEASDNAEVPNDKISIPATGHSLSAHSATKGATCLIKGTKAYWECTLCNTIFDSEDTETANRYDSLDEWDSYETEYGDHTLITHEARPANCIQDGWETYYECPICESYFSDNDQSEGHEAFENCKISNSSYEDLVASNWNGYHPMTPNVHDISAKVESTANCITPGYPEHYECNICGTWFSDQNGTGKVDKAEQATKDPNTHALELIKHEQNTSPTCKAEGWSQDVYECKACEKYYTEADEATNTTTGEGKTLDELQDENIYLGYSDHNYDTTTDTLVQPNCQTKEIKLITNTCSVCGHTTVATEEGDYGPHAAEIVSKEAKCTEPGLAEHYECSVCGKWFDKNDTDYSDPLTEDQKAALVIKVDHDYTGEIKIVTPANCTDYAYITIACSYGCGAVEPRFATDADGDDYKPTGHKLDKHDAVEGANCQTQSTAEYWQCTECGALYDADNTSDDHKINASTIEEWDGYYTGYGPHHTTKVGGKEPTCKETGMKEHLECSVCNNYFEVGENGYVGNQIDDKTSVVLGTVDHDYTKGKIVGTVINATCLENATVEVACVYDCGARANREATEDDAKEYQATGHTFKEYHDGNDPTCSAAGNYGYVECDVCGIKQICESIDKADTKYAGNDDVNRDIEPNNHKLEKGEEARAVTCTVDGIVENYVCEYCGSIFADQNGDKELDTIYIKAEGHKFTEDGAHTAPSPADCYYDGNIEYYTCDVCEKNFYTNEPWDNAEIPEGKTVIPATGHTLVGGNNSKTPTCVDDGWDEYWTCSACGKLFDVATQDDEDIKEFDSEHFICNSFEDIQSTDHYYATGTGKHIHLINHPEKQATCIEGDDGWKEYWECPDCNKLFSTNNQDDEADPISGHVIEKLEEWDGYTSYDKVAHEIEDEPKSDANCITPGYPEHYECEVCHLWFNDADGDSVIDETPDTDINSNKHIGVWEVYDAQIDATCLKDYWQYTVYQCSSCKAFYSTHDGAITETENKLGNTLDDLKNKGIYAEKLAHNYEGGRRVVHDPFQVVTCTTDGWQLVDTYCVMCNDAYSTNVEKINKTGHNMSASDAHAATCLEDGVPLYYTCENCGKLYADNGDYTENIYNGDTTISATGHSFELVTDDAEEATCMKEGRKAHYICTNGNCDIPGAKFLSDADDMATKGDDDSAFVIEKNPDNHVDISYEEGYPAICETWTKGLRECYVCACGNAYFEKSDTKYENPLSKEAFEIEPEHQSGEPHRENEVPATCETNGSYDWVTRCTVCNTITAEEKNQVINATGHNFTDYKSNENATCLTDGTETAVCDNCGEKTNTRTEANSATGHDFVLVDEKAKGATCLEDGVKAHYECTNDNCDLTVDGVKAKFLDDTNPKAEEGVDDSELVIEKNLDQASHVNLHFEKGYDPICSPWTVGMRAHYTCDCGTYYEVDDTYYKTPLTKADFEIAPQHTLADMGEQPATCEVDGYNHYWECTVEGCGAQFLADTPDVEPGVNYDDDIKLPATDHKGGEVQIENVVKGEDCQHHGSHDEVIYCVNEWCDVEGGKELSRVNVEDEVGDHVAAEPQWEDVVDATCTEDGHYDLVTRCELCKTELDRVPNQVIDARGHDWGEWETVVSPDCENGGSAKRTCPDCGTVETKDLDQNGHEWETDENGDEQYTIDKEPTCTEDGSQSIHCKNCDVQKDSETLPATGHDWSDWDTVVEPDCENGGSAERTCSNCGNSETKDLEANGHDWEEDYTIDEAPTCTEEGSKSIHCKNCDETKNSETVPALGHDIVTDPAVAPTATENGLTEGEHCSRGDYKKEQQVIPATGEYALAILEGADQLYLISSNEAKTIVCSGNYNMFVELLLNGVRVDASNYTLAEGSTIVTFKPEYLNTLAPGKYKVTLVYTYDSIDTTLTVVEKTTDAPSNGNTSPTSPLTGLAITIPVFSLAALAGGFFSLGYARKKKNEDKD